MEPVTHVLTGACLSRTGLNRLTAYATLTMAVAAEFPDIDTLWSLRGPVEGFVHHRGITHTFLGIPFEAGVVVGAVYLLHRGRRAYQDHRLKATPLPTHSQLADGPRSIEARRRVSSHRLARALPKANAGTKAAPPVRWGRLYGLALIALLSHLLLDFTNNYGLRPFFPFDSHWLAASIVFIFDPLIFALLLLALVVPAIFRLVGTEVGAKRQPFPARGWAIAALFGVTAVWGLRAAEHSRAEGLAMAESFAAPASVAAGSGNGHSASAAGANGQASGDVSPAATGAAGAGEPSFVSPLRVLANPDPLSPFKWYTVSDFGSFYQLGEADTRNGALTQVDGIYSKPGGDPATLAAEASRLGRAYLDWSPMPIVTLTHPADAEAGAEDGDGRAAGLALVTFRDPRFMGNTTLLHQSDRTPLTGTVEVDAKNRVVRESVDGRAQK